MRSHLPINHRDKNLGVVLGKTEKGSRPHASGNHLRSNLDFLTVGHLDLPWVWEV